MAFFNHLTVRNTFKEKGGREMKIKFYLSVFTVFSFITIFVGFRSVNSASETGADLFVDKMKNDVKIKKATSEVWQDAKLKMALSIGDSIKTGENSFATLKYSHPKDNCFQLYQNTEITVAQLIKGKDKPLKKVSIDMLKGGTWSKLKDIKGQDFKFNLSTPNTIAAISGTALATIVYSEDDTYFCACDGVIEIGTPGKSVTIKRCQGTTVKGMAAPSPPVSDKYIITEKKYEKDARYAWCIHCHSMMKKECAPKPKPKTGIFPGCAGPQKASVTSTCQ